MKQLPNKQIEILITGDDKYVLFCEGCNRSLYKTENMNKLLMEQKTLMNEHKCEEKVSKKEIFRGTYRIDKQLQERLEAEAERDNRSVNNMIETLLKEALAARESK